MISTYSELQTAVNDRLARSDFSAAQTQECIALCEAEMQRRLRTTDMETRLVDFTINGEFVAVPTDFLQVRDFYLNDSCKTELTHMVPEQMTRTYGPQTGKPTRFCVVGGEFRFAKIPDADYLATLVYFAKIPALDSATPTVNWLLTSHPDAYLYGSCKHGAIRLHDAEKAAGYEALFQQALADIKSSSDRRRWSGPGLTMTPG